MGEIRNTGAMEEVAVYMTDGACEYIIMCGGETEAMEEVRYTGSVHT